MFRSRSAFSGWSSEISSRSEGARLPETEAGVVLERRLVPEHVELGHETACYVAQEEVD
jgi:hypothetical protein